jgi:hypothetical protein
VIPFARRTTSSAESFTGVFDLGGNVWEWEDACYDDSVRKDLATCYARGGAVELRDEGRSALPLRRLHGHSLLSIHAVKDACARFSL